MGSFRFRKSFKLAPGIRLNIGKRTVGVSGGVRGARTSINSRGQKSTWLGIPGTGLGWRSTSWWRRRKI
jgi:hypothetical protein